MKVKDLLEQLKSLDGERELVISIRQPAQDNKWHNQKYNVPIFVNGKPQWDGLISTHITNQQQAKLSLTKRMPPTTKSLTRVCNRITVMLIRSIHSSNDTIACSNSDTNLPVRSSVDLILFTLNDQTMKYLYST